MLFKNKRLYHEFISDGFVVIKLFESLQISRFTALAETMNSPLKKGLLPSLRFQSAEENIRLHREIAAIASDSLDMHFENYSFVANHFITKTAMDENEFRLHQDWNVVDERKFIAAHIWCPLHPTDENNGGLFVVKGSHLFFNNYRSGSLGIAFIDSTEYIKNHVTSFKLNAGEAVVYNQRLFHGSYPNFTGHDRNTVLISIKPREAKMMNYYKEAVSNRSIEIVGFEITPELLFEQITELEKGIAPKGVMPAEKINYEGPANDEINNSLFETHLKKKQHPARK